MVFVEAGYVKFGRRFGYGELTSFLEDDKCKFRKWKRVLAE